MKPSNLSKLAKFGFLLALLTLPATQALAQQDILITYKQDLSEANPRGKNLPIPNNSGIEAACVATALARNLQSASSTSGQTVAMFPALAGVKLANQRLLLESELGAQLCFDPGHEGYFSDDFGFDVPDDYTLLIDLVRQFLKVEGRMVVCPLCWYSRAYDGATYPVGDLFLNAEIGTPDTVGPLFLNAQKVIDF